MADDEVKTTTTKDLDDEERRMRRESCPTAMLSCVVEVWWYVCGMCMYAIFVCGCVLCVVCLPYASVICGIRVVCVCVVCMCLMCMCDICMCDICVRGSCCMLLCVCVSYLYA